MTIFLFGLSLQLFEGQLLIIILQFMAITKTIFVPQHKCIQSESTK